ncbi:MAG: radical SAM protein [Deltaproteobacteria bacterium]|nr:radical SAM protein [Deltaproteobacteria bacterium]
MNILLIYPYPLEDRLQADDVNVVPIGLWYIAAVLKERGHQIEVLNWFDMKNRASDIERELIRRKPDIIGCSILNANRWGGIEIARIAKKIDPNVKVVFGGPTPTCLWEHFLTHFSEIDLVVIGEGERSFLNLIEHLSAGDSEGMESVSGIAFRKEGRCVRTKDADRIELLDELPIPSRYFRYQHVASSRGCVNKCTFCASPSSWDRRIRTHSPDYFVDQIELLVQKGVSFFYVSDDTFTIHRDRVIAICKMILERNLKISWYAISHVGYVDVEILYWMRKAGCIQISYGVESGSEKIRKQLQKHITNDQIRRAFKLTTQYGILARAYLIYGCPGETWETIQETIDLIHDIKPLSVVFYILDIFPGTALYNDMIRRLDLSDDIWLEEIEDIMYWETDPALSKDLVLSFGQKLRSDYHRHLSDFADAVELVDDPELYTTHAEFLSRLGLTFTHGDYAGIEAIPEKEATAARLFERSLAYRPNARAYLGLGTILQKRGEHRESIRLLAEGAARLPDIAELNICLGVSYMNLGRFKEGLECFSKFPNDPQARRHMETCLRALGK